MTRRYLTISEQLDLMARWIGEGQPFIHLRFNDGECNAMFGDMGEDQVNCDGHHYFSGLGRALTVTLGEILSAHLNFPELAWLLGTHAWHDPEHPAAKRLLPILEEVDRRRPLPRSYAGFWHSDPPAQDDGLLYLLDTLRESGRAILVANKKVREARHCIGAGIIQVPSEDAWLATDKVMDAIGEPAHHGCVFVWCAGMAGKVWAWDTLKEFPQSSHIDAGHVFDAAFDLRTRLWMQERGRMWDDYQRLVGTYVRKFLMEDVANGV